MSVPIREAQVANELKSLGIHVLKSSNPDNENREYKYMPGGRPVYYSSSTNRFGMKWSKGAFVIKNTSLSNELLSDVHAKVLSVIIDNVAIMKICSALAEEVDSKISFYIANKEMIKNASNGNILAFMSNREIEISLLSIKNRLLTIFTLLLNQYKERATSLANLLENVERSIGCPEIQKTHELAMTIFYNIFKVLLDCEERITVNKVDVLDKFINQNDKTLKADYKSLIANLIFSLIQQIDSEKGL